MTDNLNISNRINRFFNMDNIFILKAANNVNERIYRANIGEELISQAFSFMGTCRMKQSMLNEILIKYRTNKNTLDKARDIDEVNLRLNDATSICDFSKSS